MERARTEAAAAGDQAQAIGGKAAARRDHGDVRMARRRRTPGTKHGDETDPGAKMCGIGPDDQHRFGGSLAKLRKRTWRDDLNKLNLYVLPRIGARKAEEIAKRDVIEIIDHIAIERNAPVQADRTKALLSSIFNWGQDEDLVQSKPADRIRTRSTRKRRTRLFFYDELKALLLDV